MSDIIKALTAPFSPEQVSWRIGATTKDKTRGMAVCYVDARDVQNRLDEACGPFNWASEHIVAADGKKVTCRIGIKHPDSDTFIWKSDGAGETDIEGDKGSYSDALKRAAVSWGIGRYLYSIEAVWVDIDPERKQIKPHELARLVQTLRGPAPPAPPAPRGLDGAMSALASRLISDLRDTRGVVDLEEWVVLEARRIETLDDANKARVRSAYAAHLRELKTRASLAA